MADDSNDKRLLELIALILQGVTEVQNMVNNKRAQAGKTDMEIAEHAEASNKKAKELIDAL